MQTQHSDPTENSIQKKRATVKKFSHKRLFIRFILWLVNCINFSKLFQKIATSTYGKSYYERFSNAPEAWEKAEQVSKTAVDLTMAQLVKEGHDIERKDIVDLIKEIEIQFDQDLYINTATTLGVLFDHIFDQQNSRLPFTSANGREIQHLETLKKYREGGLGVVYLINHSSHLDEFMVDLLWQYLGLGLPVFAAGQNMMRIKSIAKLLMIGSYVVLRHGANRHQMSALYNYCRAISMCGEQQGIFLEAWRGGARTRDGSLRYPKRLVTLRGAIDVDKDLVIQPVAISFSAVPEDLPMSARKSGISWIRGLGFFRTLLRIPFSPKRFLWESAKNIYGRANISMPKPFLLSELKQEHLEDKSGIHLDEFVALSCINAIAESKKIMASHITALGIHAARKTGETDLLESVSQQIWKTKEYHKTAFATQPDFEDFILENSIDDVVKDGLAMLTKRGVLKKWRKDAYGYPIVKSEAALSYYATHADRRLYSPTADQNIVVMGAGNWGFALAFLIGYRILEDKKYSNASLTIFDPRKKIAKKMGLNRNGPGHFSETILPKNVFVTSDFSAAFRKASDVIIAMKPADFEDNFRTMLTTAEQGLKVMIATRGFLPKHHTLPYLFAQELVNRSKRDDVQIYTLSGVVEPETLVDIRQVKGILGGPDKGLDDLAELFDRSFVQAFLSNDPVGVQTADILARIYAIWVNFVQSSGSVKNNTEIGYLMARIGDEACALAVHLGGRHETFEAGSIPWTAVFTSLCLEGLWHTFGQKAGKAVKKGKQPGAAYKKLKAQYENDGIHIQALDDMEGVLERAGHYNLDMPVLRLAMDTFTAE